MREHRLKVSMCFPSYSQQPLLLSSCQVPISPPGRDAG